MSDVMDGVILTALVVTCGLVLVGLGVAVNRWESARARQQFSALAAQYQGVVTDARPWFGAAPLRMTGVYQGQSFTVQTRIGGAGRVNIGGVMTPVQGVITHVAMNGKEVWLPEYMKSARARGRVEQALAQLAQ